MPDRAVPAAQYVVHLHGAAHLRPHGGAAVALERKQALLLAYLSIEGPTPRGKLAGLLWPDAAEARARGNLRQRLSMLRQAVCDHLVVDMRGVLSLSPRLSVQQAGAGAAPLLATFEFDDCPDCAAWLEAQRAAQQSAQRAELLTAVRAAVQTGQLDEALRLADQLLGTDRESEEAYRTQMEVLYLRGDTAAAIAVWDRCRLMLRQLYGVAPSSLTQQLGQTLLHAQAGAAATAPGVAGAMPITLLRPPRLIARQNVLDGLLAAWRRGHTLCVGGDAGLGKSRLLAEFAAAAGPCAVAAARPGDAGVPYASFSRLLLLAIERFEPALDGADAREAARLLPRLAAVLPDAPVGDPVQTDHQRRQCLRAAARVLAHCSARGCCALVFDDLQFADAASVEAVVEMAEAGVPPLRWAFGVRSDELGAVGAALLAALGAGGALLRVELAPLQPADVAELVASLALPGFDAAFAQRLWQQIGGNPAFVLESVKLVLALGGPAALGSDALPLAPDIVAVVERRIALLNAPARHLAQLAAVAGDSWSVPLAAAALACTPLALSEPLRELELRQVLYGRHFVHDVIGVAARRSVAQSVAEFMHRFVAGHLAQHGGDPARIAAHWQACGDDRLAGDAYRAAASAAEQSARPAEQCDLLDAAAACYERAGASNALFDTLEAGLHTVKLLDRFTTRLAQLERLEALAETEEQRLRALTFRQGLQTDNPRDDVPELGADAVARALALGKPAIAFELAGQLAWRLAMAGQPGTALQTLDARWPWVARDGSAIERGNFHRLRAGVLGLSEQLAAATDESRLALAEWRAAGRPVHMLATLNNLGLFQHWRGELECAKATFQEAVELRNRLHGPGTDMFDLLLGLLLHDLADYAGAEGLLLAAVAELSTRTGAAQGDARAHLVFARNYLAQLWLSLGQPALAHAQLGDDDDDDDDLAPRFRWRPLALRLRCASQQGRSAAALLARAQSMLQAREPSFNRSLLALEVARLLPPRQALGKV